MRKRGPCAARMLLVMVIVIGLLPVAGLETADAQRDMTVSPAQGPIGLEVKVCAIGMTPNGTIPVGNLMFDGSPWNTRPLALDSSGDMCCSVLVVPQRDPERTYTLQATDDHGNISWGYFTITRPTIEISPAAGYRGQEVKVTGKGWVPLYSPVMITFSPTRNGSVVQEASVQKVTPDGNGRFTTEFTVPLDAESVNLVGAYDFLGNRALGRQFSLKPPSLTVDPVVGPPGITAVVTGRGFWPLSPVSSLMFDRINIMPPGGLVTDNMGHFTSPFIVPDLAAAAYLVSAEVGGVKLTTCFRIIGYRAPLESEPLANMTLPVSSALASIEGQLVRVWGYQDGKWRMYDPEDLAGSNLTGLMKDRAYWVLVDADCTLIFRKLKAGWNPIGW